MPTVEYNRNSYNRCLCGGCPVIRKSKCIGQQTKFLQDQKLIESIQKESWMPDASRMPGIYCSIGRSKCGDLSVKKVCLCPVCSVTLIAHLNKNYYCLHGSAAEIG